MEAFLVSSCSNHMGISCMGYCHNCLSCKNNKKYFMNFQAFKLGVTLASLQKRWTTVLCQWVLILPDTCIHGIVKLILRDHCHERPPVLKKQIFPAKCPISWYFSDIEPATKDHLFWETTFVWPIGWSFTAGSPVAVRRVQRSSLSRHLP